VVIIALVAVVVATWQRVTAFPATHAPAVEPLPYDEDRVEVGALPPAVLMQLVEDDIPVCRCEGGPDG
jgi:hypothetical protein